MSHTISMDYVPGLVILSRLKLVSRQDTEYRRLLRTRELACCDLLAIARNGFCAGLLVAALQQVMGPR